MLPFAGINESQIPTVLLSFWSLRGQQNDDEIEGILKRGNIEAEFVIWIAPLCKSTKQGFHLNIWDDQMLGQISWSAIDSLRISLRRHVVRCGIVVNNERCRIAATRLGFHSKLFRYCWMKSQFRRSKVCKFNNLSNIPRSLSLLPCYLMSVNRTHCVRQMKSINSGGEIFIFFLLKCEPSTKDWRGGKIIKWLLVASPFEAFFFRSPSSQNLINSNDFLKSALMLSALPAFVRCLSIRKSCMRRGLEMRSNKWRSFFMPRPRDSDCHYDWPNQL